MRLNCKNLFVFVTYIFMLTQHRQKVNVLMFLYAAVGQAVAIFEWSFRVVAARRARPKSTVGPLAQKLYTGL